MLSTRKALTDAEVNANIHRLPERRIQSPYLTQSPAMQVHVVDLSVSQSEASAAILHACVTTGFFYGMLRRP